MSKRHPQLDEAFFPKQPLSYKHVPLENQFGQGLQLCQHCKGVGRLITATRTKESGIAGVPKIETIAATFRQVAKLKKDGWCIQDKQCQACGGSGMLVNKTI